MNKEQDPILNANDIVGQTLNDTDIEFNIETKNMIQETKEIGLANAIKEIKV